MENETRPEDPLVEWGEYEARFPDLQLTHFRDKLEWLYGGEPDHPDVSLENWKLFRTKMSGRKANEAAPVGIRVRLEGNKLKAAVQIPAILALRKL
jgi:hypothetical protein